MSNGYKHYAGLKGSKIKTVGSDADIYQYTSLATCFGDAQPNDVIEIHDGTYTLTAAITIDYSVTLVGLGNVVITGAVADRLFMINKPAAGTTVTTIRASNIQFTNTTASADCIEMDNDGGGTGNLVTEWNDCGFTSNAGLAFDIDQTTATIDVFHYINGNRRRPLDDDCNFSLTKAGSEIHVSGYLLGGGETFILGATDVASVYFFNDIIFSSAALTSTGAASIIMNMTNCAKIASDAIVAPALGDLDATGDENILVGSILT